MKERKEERKNERKKERRKERKGDMTVSPRYGGDEGLL